MAKVRRYPAPPSKGRGYYPTWLERDAGPLGKFSWRRK